MFEEIKKLPLQQVQSIYCEYLKNQSLSHNAIKTSKTDAFYLWRNNNAVDFWEMLSNPPTKTMPICK